MENLEEIQVGEMSLTSNLSKTMKTILSILSSASAIILAVTSCQKQMNEAPQADSHTVTFVTEDSDTRTSIIADASEHSVRFTWTNTPVSFIHLYENGKEGSSATCNTSDNDSKATLSATFSGIALGSIDYRAVIAGSYSNGIASVPDIQHPSTSSFDPAADILLGKPAKTYYARPASVLNTKLATVSLLFARANAITRLELSGLNAGEKVEVIEISADNNIAGPLKAFENFQYKGYDTENGKNKITLEFTSDNTVGTDGKFVTFFSSWAVAPGGFSITVVTDKKMYSKNAPADVASRFEFIRDVLGDLRITVNSQSIPDSRFELVTGIPSNWDGTYLIANANSQGQIKVLNATAKSQGYATDATVSKISGKIIIEATDAMKSLAWDFNDSGKEEDGVKLWNVMTGSAGLIISSAEYLYDNNGITVSSSNYSGLIISRKYFYHSFSADGNGVQMTSRHDGKHTYLGYNGSAFAYTSDASNRIFLFKYYGNTRENQVLAYDNEVENWVLTEGGYEIGKTYDGQAFASSSKYQKELLSFTSSDTSIATVDSDGRVTIKAKGDVTITATAASNTNYKGASASYVIRIYEPYYQRITSSSEVTSGSKYLIVSRTELLGSWYHAFDATNEKTYDYDINTAANLLSSPIYDSGMKIKPSAAIDANQVLIEKSVLGSLTGKNTIKPLSVNKYLYCNTEITDVVSSEIKIPTYAISFAESTGSSWLSQLEQITTAPHSIKFNEDGTVVLTSGLDKLGVGGTLYYSKLSGKFSYVNLMIFDQFSDITELMAYLGQNSEYAELLKWINTLGKDITVRDIIDFFSAEVFLYKYID